MALPMKAKPRKFGPRLTVSLTDADYAKLNALAEKEDVSASWVVRRAIDEYLDRHAGAQSTQPAGFGAARESRAAMIDRPQTTGC